MNTRNCKTKKKSDSTEKVAVQMYIQNFHSLRTTMSVSTFRIKCGVFTIGKIIRDKIVYEFFYGENSLFFLKRRKIILVLM